MSAASPAGHSYLDRPSLVSRAHSALLRAEAIVEDRGTPAEVRLVRLAEVMAAEPVLTDGGAGACSARKAAARYNGGAR